jgi:hypothetical protein
MDGWKVELIHEIFGRGFFEIMGWDEPPLRFLP